MNLLKAALYDPAVAVTKNTTAALAMTAIDTTNLRLAITVPAHGMVRFRLASCIHGAATYPSILLGVMNGATVIGRAAPVQSLGNTAVATALVNVEAEFTVTGLAPGAMNVDAAYAVETLVAATGLKYGGPNNTVANDAFGAFVFEAWDPQPQSTLGQFAVDANGRTDVGRVLGTAQTAGDLKASLNTLQADTDDIQTRLPAALVGGRMDSSVGAMAANVITAASIAALALVGKGDWISVLVDTSGVTTLLARLTALRAIALDNIDATVSSRSTFAGGAVASVTGAVGFVTGLTAADVGAIKAKTDNLPSDPADQSLIIGATDVIRSDIAAIPAAPSAVAVAAQVLVSAAAAPIASELKKINGVTLIGDGSATPWGP